MNFNQFVREVTNVILMLNKDKIYIDSTLHIGVNKEFKMEMWSYDWDLEKEFEKMKSKFNWKEKFDFEKYYDYHYIYSYKNDNCSKGIIFVTETDLSSEKYEYDLKMIKEMIEYLNIENLTKM